MPGLFLPANDIDRNKTQVCAWCTRVDSNGCVWLPPSCNLVAPRHQHHLPSTEYLWRVYTPFCNVHIFSPLLFFFFLKKKRKSQVVNNPSSRARTSAYTACALVINRPPGPPAPPAAITTHHAASPNRITKPVPPLSLTYIVLSRLTYISCSWMFHLR